MDKRIAVAWTVLLAGFIFNSGAYALTMVGLQQPGFVELNPIIAVLFRLWGFAGTYLFVLLAYFAIVRLFARIAFKAPAGNAVFVAPVFVFGFASFDFSRNLLLLAEKGGMV